MRNALVALAGLLATSAAAAPAGPAGSPPPLNVTGKWEGANTGFYGRIRQVGNVVSGRCAHDCAYQGRCEDPDTAGCYVRGAYLGEHVVLTAYYAETCQRSTFIADNSGKLSPLVGTWVGEWNGLDGITRTGADGGAPVTYPYAHELERCGDVVTYELSFDVGSAAIKNPDAPVLAAMAGLLRSKPEAKLRVVGHTDSTGSAEANKKLSLARAGSVKARIVELSKADPGRVAVEGMGPEQPLESNDKPAGRALNRRVEITLGR